MPRGILFIGVGDPKKHRFIKRFGQDLQPDRKTLFGKSAGIEIAGIPLKFAEIV